MTLLYPEETIDRLTLLWGTGFLSPGGADEVLDIVRGFDLTGKRVLDIGCGTAGPSITLVRDCGAHVVCLDVEEPVLDRASRNADAAGTSGQMEFVLVVPDAPLPFCDGSFDLVFSKDALIHVAEKAAIYREILRVLKPGSFFAASDWLCSETAQDDPHFLALTSANPEFIMSPPSVVSAHMRAAGFVDVICRDRSAWYGRECRREVDLIAGPLSPALIARLGREAYDKWLAYRRIMANAAASGSLSPTHLFGRRPLPTGTGA